MRVSVNAFFLPQPYTGSGQYVRHLLPALTRVAPTLNVVPLLPAPRAARRAEAPLAAPRAHHVGLPGWLAHADLRKVWWEQVAWMRAAHGRAADVTHVPYFGAAALDTAAACRHDPRPHPPDLAGVRHSSARAPLQRTHLAGCPAGSADHRGFAGDRGRYCPATRHRGAAHPRRTTGGSPRYGADG